MQAREVVKQILWSVSLLVVFAFFITLITITYFSFSLPKIKSLEDYKPPIPSKILARDGTVLGIYGIEKREIVKFDEIPQNIIDAFLAAEDDKFYSHKGVDYLGVLRALIANLKAGRVVQGGSTITQQVAKSLLSSKERSYSRKIKDFLLAQKLEERFSKEEILFLYLNQVYLGGGYYGIKEAFRGYFDKSLDEASVAETAMVAGLLVAPGRYSPYLNPTAAKMRQKYVLDRLLITEKINKDEFDLAVQEKIKFRIKDKFEFKANYFTEWVRQRVTKFVGEEKFLEDGFTIQTTLDYDMQKIGEAAINNGLKNIDKRQGFKGPLRSIDMSTEQYEFQLEARRKLYMENSNFFTLDDQNERVYELDFDEETFKQKYDERIEVKPTSKFPEPLISDDVIIDYLKQDVDYEALVLSVNDDARLVFVSLAGAYGFIAYDDFKWAHERTIIEDKPSYFPFVTKPSTILKAGDVILVRIKNLRAHLSNSIESKVFDKLSKDEKQNIKSVTYLQFSLEQNAEVQGALVAIHPNTGEVISFVGGKNYSESKFNRVIQSLRQPGSAFKPFIYAASLEEGYLPNSIILDSPEAMSGAEEGPNWKPRNYDGKYKGPITLRTALELSRNIPVIKVTYDIGIDKLMKFLKRLGIEGEFPLDLSISLGSLGISLIDLVKAYGIFPNNGKKIILKSITSITDRAGNYYQVDENEAPAEVESGETNKTEVVSNSQIDEKEQNVLNYKELLDEHQVYDVRLSYLITKLLNGVILNGTGKAARAIGDYLGGKTGTTSNFVDAWFLGFSNSVTTGVWTGFDDNKTMGYGESGTRAALPIWQEFMQAVVKKYGFDDFPAPPGVINFYINKDTGDPTPPGSANSYLESFVEGTEPSLSSRNNENLIKGSTQGSSNKGLFEEEDYFNQN